MTDTADISMQNTSGVKVLNRNDNKCLSLEVRRSDLTKVKQVQNFKTD